ncbi:hypothetical protein RYX36_020378 [Vicia faba]
MSLLEKASSSGEVEEMICSNNVVEVENGLEEDENGKLGGEHEEGRCELMVVVESGRPGEGEGGWYEQVVVVVMDICMASCVVLGSGR